MPEDDKTLTKLVSFTRETLCPREVEEPIEADTPLLGLGVLDSLKTAILLNYIRDDLGVTIPAAALNTANFQDLRSIAALVDTIAPTAAR
jgi:clorobiocin biosynthesis protein CloN5